MGNNVYGAIALKTSSGALDLIDGINLLPGDIALVVTDTNSYFYKLFSNDVSEENSPYIIKPVLNGSNKRWRLTSISETSGDLSVLGKLMVNKIGFTGNTLSIVSTNDTPLATFDKIGQSVAFKKISAVEDTSVVTGLNAEKVGGKSGNLMMLTDGSEVFTAPIVGISPTLDSHLTTKLYVDTLINAIDTTTATDFLINNQLTVNNITTQVGNNLTIKTHGPSGTTLATFDGSSVAFKKISSVEDTSMVNGLNAEYIRGTTLDGLLKADGSVPFTGTVSGQPPTLNTHLATKGYVDSVDLTKASKGVNSDITSLSGLTTPLSVAQGGTGGTTALGTAAYVDTGTGAGDVPILDAGGKLDAGVLPVAMSIDALARDLAIFNALLSQIGLGRASGPIPSGYMHLFATDELATKTNANYDTVGRDYHNGALSGTKYTLTSGMFSASGGWTLNSAAALIDGATGSGAGSYINTSAAVGANLAINLGSAVLLGKFRIYREGSSAPYGIKVQYSDDNWATAYDATSPVTLSVGWNDFTWAPSIGAHRYWRFITTITADVANQWCSEVEAYTYSVTNMTLVPAAVTAGAAPNSVDIYMLHKPIDSVTLNTDIKVRATRDNGANWSGYVTLAEICQHDTEYKLLKGTADLSALASGTSVAWEISTLNAKVQRVRAVAMILNS